MARPRSVDDSELLPKAMRTFWQNGFATTGIRELEQSLGLKAPAIYHRFGSKEALFHAALAHYIETVVGNRIRILLLGDSFNNAPLEGLRRFFDTTYDYISEKNPPLACLLVNTSLESLSSDPAVAALLEQGGRRVRAAFNKTLQQAQILGQLTPSAHTEALADALHLGLQGLLVSSKVLRDPATLKRQVDHLFALLPVSDLAGANPVATEHSTAAAKQIPVSPTDPTGAQP